MNLADYYLNKVIEHQTDKEKDYVNSILNTFKFYGYFNRHILALSKLLNIESYYLFRTPINPEFQLTIDTYFHLSTHNHEYKRK